MPSQTPAIKESITEFFSLTAEVYEAIETRDGESFAELVSFKHPHVANPRFRALPVMYAVALDLRVFASNADQQLVKKGKSKVGDMLEKAAELLMSCFRVCASDTAIDSSNLKEDYSTAQRVTYRYYVGRKAMFDSDFKQAEEYLSFAFEHCHCLSQKNKRMILIYLLPVKMLLGHMPTIELLKKYHLMQFAEVTRAVSEGNLLLLNEALAKHETFFIRCGIFLILEKLKIITYRNLFKKVYLLLKTHQLSLDAFLVALKFMQVEDVDIDEVQCILANLIYMLKIITYRNLFKKAYLLLKTNQLPLDAFLVALKFMQVEDVDIDEVQCILANLIYMGHIKGYISHQHQKLVVSKQNPFPPLSTVC
ncbi:PCI domain-containing protein 2 [Myotis brandtii]|uniref:PCI domain-containing protein 2 n=1 Tax=Myotis brandtii TaxID=109478 RepID=S7NQT1_MYOBR|nr:PCI domain-containing protein 2 [Myotis brandtii]